MITGAILVGIVVLVGVVGPFVAPHDPLVQTSGAQLLPPSASHFLGTDQFGRDVLSRLLSGTATSLLIVVLAVTIGGLLGLALGAIAGYRGGRFDEWVGRGVDVLLAYPAIIVGVIIVAILGPGSMKVGIALAVFNIPVFARVVRAVVLQERMKEYVVASECIGASDTRTLVRHIMPNVLGPVLVQYTLALGAAVVVEASLSFLGLGVQAPAASLGTLIQDGKQYLYDSLILGIAPGVVLTVLVFGLNLIADGVQKPKNLRGRA